MDYSNLSESASGLPSVTVGVPTFNNESTILTTLESLVNQTYKNIEVIVSNDSSTDATKQLIEEFASKQSNFKIVTQKSNLGLYRNMAFCAQASKSKYFMWLAGDDFISKEFIESNVNFLECNPGYVASSSEPFYLFENKCEAGNILNLEGDLLNRIKNFLNNTLWSHNVYYSVFRTDTVTGFRFLGESFAAADWVFDLYLLSLGRVKCNSRGKIFFGTNGVSRSLGANRKFGTGKVEKFIPMWPLTKKALSLDILSYRVRLLIIWKLLIINMHQLNADITILSRTTVGKRMKLNWFRKLLRGKI